MKSSVCERCDQQTDEVFEITMHPECDIRRYVCSECKQEHLELEQEFQKIMRYWFHDLDKGKVDIG